MSGMSPNHFFKRFEDPLTADGIDFSSQIESAIGKARLYSDEADAALTAEHLRRYADLPDNEIIVTKYVREPDEVSTTSLVEYLTLMVQAFQLGRVACGKPKPSFEAVLRSGVVMDNLKHESDHALSALAHGNSHTVPHLGVKFGIQNKGGERVYCVVPFVAVDGPLAKIHRGQQALAPSKPSLTDYAIARSMQCDPYDMENVQRRARAVPPVPESWGKLGGLFISGVAEL